MGNSCKAKINVLYFGKAKTDEAFYLLVYSMTYHKNFFYCYILFHKIEISILVVSLVEVITFPLSNYKFSLEIRTLIIMASLTDSAFILQGEF